jgi:hypothetical protein
MFAEENSKLISGLYNAKNRQEVSDILELIGESGDPVFVYPLLDGYTRCKQSTIGYYFIWSLSRLDYPELGKRLSELLESYEIEKDHIPMVLFFMAERRFFSVTGDRMAEMYIEACTDPQFHKDFAVNGLGIGCILDYIYESGKLADYEAILRAIVFSDAVNQGERIVALTFLMEINQEEQINFLMENYQEKLRGTFLEEHVAKRLLFCQTRNVEKLKDMIVSGGQEKPLAVLGKYEYLPRLKSGSGEMTVYRNVEVVIKIGIMREQINKKAIASERFGFRVFPLNPMIMHQSQCIDDKDIFLDLCRDLLNITSDINPKVRNHGIGEGERGIILAGIPQSKWDRNVTHLQLFIYDKQICINAEMFGFRTLNKMLETLTEDKQDDEFFGRLEGFGIADLYRKKQWHRIHSVLTNSYLQTLETMNKELGQFIKQDLGKDSRELR